MSRVHVPGEPGPRIAPQFDEVVQAIVKGRVWDPEDAAVYLSTYSRAIIADELEALAEGLEATSRKTQAVTVNHRRVLDVVAATIRTRAEHIRRGPE